MASWFRRRPKATDVHAVATRVQRVPDAEIAVVEAALAGGGPLAERLLRQLREAEHVWRHRADDGAYQLRISTTDQLSVRDVPRDGWTSPWIPVVAASGGRRIHLQVVVVEAGIVALAGRTEDGRQWPDAWQADAGGLVAIRAAAPWLRLPTPTELRASRARATEAIGGWLGDVATIRGRRGVIRAEPPATPDEIADFAMRESFVLPEAYRSLLAVADGIEIKQIVVLGTRDAYRLDMPGPPRLVIVPPDEDGAITLAEGGEVVKVTLGEARGDGRVAAADLRAWLMRRLR